MAITSYSKKDRLLSRKMHIRSQFFNTVSFQFLASTIVTTYLLKFDAQEIVGGIISGFPFTSSIFVLFGKFFMKRLGFVKTYGVFWLIRYLVVLPMMLSPILYIYGFIDSFSVIVLTLTSLGFFQIARGIAISVQGIISNEVSEGPDKGTYLTTSQVVIQFSVLFASFSIAYLLGLKKDFLYRFFPIEDPSLYTYFFIYLAGLIIGLIACFLIFKIKEPKIDNEGTNTSFRETFKYILENKNTARFYTFIILVYFVINFSRPFLIFYARRIYDIPDGNLLYLNMIASIGSIMIGFLFRIFIDKIGEKPAMVMGSTIFFIFLLILVSLKQFNKDSHFAIFLILGLLFFLQGMAELSIAIGEQKYLFSIMHPKHQVNMNMLSGILKGFSGSISAILGGSFIIFIQEKLFVNNTIIQNYRFFFLCSSLMFLVPLFFLSRLKRFNALSSAQAFWTLLNPSNIITINIIKKLETNESIEKDISNLYKLNKASFLLSKNEISKRLDSPFASVKKQAIKTLSKIKINYKNEKHLKTILSKELEKKNNIMLPYILKIISHNSLKDFVKQLLLLLEKEEDKKIKVQLINCLIAILKEKSYETISKFISIKDEEDEDILFELIRSIGLSSNEKAISFLIKILKKDNIKEYISNEAVFVMSKIYGFGKEFYIYYNEYLKENEDLKEDIFEFFSKSKHKKDLENLYQLLYGKHYNSFLLSLYSLIESEDKELDYFKDKEIYKHDSMKFFIIMYIGKAHRSKEIE